MVTIQADLGNLKEPLGASGSSRPATDDDIGCNSAGRYRSRRLGRASRTGAIAGRCREYQHTEQRYQGWNRQRLGSNDGCCTPNSSLEHVLRDIRRRTRVVVGAFPNG